MFTMIIERQLNLEDRTLLLGIPEFDAIPKIISIDGEVYEVLGISQGAKPPYISLEIEMIYKDVTDKEAVEAQ